MTPIILPAHFLPTSWKAFLEASEMSGLAEALKSFMANTLALSAAEMPLEASTSLPIQPHMSRAAPITLSFRSLGSFSRFLAEPICFSIWPWQVLTKACMPEPPLAVPPPPPPEPESSPQLATRKLAATAAITNLMLIVVSESLVGKNLPLQAYRCGPVGARQRGCQC